MYISASDYNTCQTYLTKDYRPMGRLKDRDRFDSDEQYQVHYDAIMSSGYANEITDFRVRENSLDKKVSPLMVWIGTALSAVLIIAFNVSFSFVNLFICCWYLISLILSFIFFTLLQFFFYSISLKIVK